MFEKLLKKLGIQNQWTFAPRPEQAKLIPKNSPFLRLESSYSHLRVTAWIHYHNIATERNHRLLLTRKTAKGHSLFLETNIFELSSKT